MRVIFMGTPTFSETILRALIQKHEVVAVYTRPDAVSGRGSKLIPSSVKEAAYELGIPVYTPENLRGADVARDIAALAPDVVVVAAYGVILPKDVLEIPRLGCINVHASLLPRWRGAAPVQRAILAGDEMAGVCIMRMEEGLDTGDFCARVKTPIADKDAAHLTAELAEAGAQALLSTLDTLEAGNTIWKVQDSSLVTYANKVAKSDVRLSHDLPVVDNLRRVRAATDAAPARATVCGKPLRVLIATESAASVDKPLAPGEVSLEGRRLVLGCSDGDFEVLELKPDGKSAMPAKAWISGLRDAPLAWKAV